MEMPTEVEREREVAWNSYSPCHFIEQVVKAFSKCLSLDPASGDGEVTATTSRALRRPPRPPLSAGRGGQINRSAS
ncbi:hypothetical protein VNO77_09831 [Canavalia gladiata]|uniref:Uncharacterized protein n=1 Tax=Canavalia gladiata TaxID=3824 RepID=A0AAN9R1P1_CANGL